MSALGALLAELAGEGVRWAVEKGRRALRRRKERAAAAEAFATTRAPVQACRRCQEISYTPGQVACFKCGWPL